MAKGVNAAMFAENMFRYLRVEPIEHQVFFTLQ